MRKSKSEFLPPYFWFNIIVYGILPFSKSYPEIEMMALDQTPNAGEESLLTRDIT